MKMKNPWSFENFKRGKLMTLLGVALIIGAAVVAVRSPDSGEFAMLMLLMGGAALGLKDPRLPGGGAGAAAAAILLLTVIAVFALSSCTTYKRCCEKFGTLATDSPKVAVDIPIDTTLEAVIEADSAETSIDLDTLCNEWQAGKLMFEDSLKTVSTKGKTQTQIWIDKYNRLLKVKAKTLRDTIYVPYQDTARAEVNCPPVLMLNPDKNLPWWAPKMLWKRFQLFAAWAVLAGLVFTVVKKAWS